MGLGAGELVLILVIAYVVVGPEDMTKLARTIAKTIRQLRKMSVDLGKEVGSEIEIPFAPEAESGIRTLSVSDLAAGTEKMAGKTVNAEAGQFVSADFDSVLKEIEKAEAHLRDTDGSAV